MKTTKKTIYKRVLETVLKEEDANVFKLIEEAGMKDVKKIMKLKREEMANKTAANLPKFEEYALPRIKRNILNELLKKYDYSFSFGDPQIGTEFDLSIPCFVAARELNTDEVNLARGVSDFINKRFNVEGELVLKSAVVHGYVNIALKKDRLIQKTLKEIERLGDLYGGSDVGLGKIVIIDYSGPNIAKPMSVGHLRSTVIGNSLKFIYEFSGFTVISVNHLGDWGTQFGKLLYALKNLALPKAGEEINLVPSIRDEINKKNVFQNFLDLYVEFHKEAEKNPELNEKAKEIFKALEVLEDSELLKDWLKICDLSVKEFRKIYKVLGVDFDLTLGESFYKNPAKKIIDKCVKDGIAEIKEEGLVVINFEDGDSSYGEAGSPSGEAGLPSFILQKSDEASVYMARDLAAAVFRYDLIFCLLSNKKKFASPILQTSEPRELGINSGFEIGDENKVIYVVGNEQTLHFKQLFKTLEKLKIGKAENFSHLSFGLVSLPEGKMSTRAGRTISLAGLLNASFKKAAEMIKEKNQELNFEEIKKIKEAVGGGAVIYADLSQFREKNIVFTWEKMMNLKGDSAPYLQYTHARIQGILRKAGIQEFDKSYLPTDMKKEEERLGFSLSEFAEAISEARELGRPDKIANYLNDLVKEFNRFYEQVPVLSSEGDCRKFRLALIKAAAQVIKNGMKLLGIKVLERI